MAEQYNLHRHDGGCVRVGLRGGLAGPQTGAHRHLRGQRARHRRLLLQPELRTLHALPLYQWCCVSILLGYLRYIIKMRHIYRIHYYREHK